jgi:hypothetical protein
MSEDGPLRTPREKEPGDRAAHLHLFDDLKRRRGGPIAWLGRHPGLLVFLLLAAAAPFAYRAIWMSPADLPAVPSPGVVPAPGEEATGAARFRKGLTPLPEAVLSAPVGAAQVLTVRAIGPDGLPITGAPVRFNVSEGVGELDVDSALTDGAGLAATTLSLPARPGRVSVVARLTASDLPGTTFTVDALAGAPTRVTMVSGDRQEAAAGALLQERLSVRVTDPTGNPVSDVEVRFRVVSGDGMVAPSRIRTDSAGEASAFWRLGAANGEQRVAALAPEADSEFLTFTATARGEAPADTPAETAAEMAPEPADPPQTNDSLDEGADMATGPAPMEPVRVLTEPFAVGGNFVCAIPGGDVSCRGANDRGQRAAGTGTGFAALTAGLAHACALTAAGEASCWGANESGQLGDGSRTDRGAPVPVSTELLFSTVVAGGSHTCGLVADGRALCWGRNLNGQLGDGSRDDRPTPRRAITGRTFVRLVAGWNHTCGSSAIGETYCWGLNDHGQLGDGSHVDRLAPTPVLSGTLASVVAGSAHTCGIRGDQVLCWGDNGFGQLGDGSTEQRNVPTPVRGLPGAPRELAAGAVSTCALLDDGSVYCWGQNLHGQLGDGTTENASRPQRVSGRHAFRSIYSGGALVCGFAEDGLDYCWGLNQSGQLGDGSRVSRSVPTRVGG